MVILCIREREEGGGGRVQEKQSQVDEQRIRVEGTWGFYSLSYDYDGVSLSDDLNAFNCSNKASSFSPAFRVGLNSFAEA